MTPRPHTLARTGGVLFATLAATLLLLTGCSTSNDQSQAAAVYNGGWWTSTSFDNCVDPGERDYHGPGDKGYQYYAGQRTFEFAGDGGGVDYPSVSAASKDNTTMTIEGLVTFQLNTDCDVLRDFHEAIGGPKKAYIDGGGWDDVLDEYLGQQLDKAVDVASKDYPYLDLYTNAQGVKEKWEDKVGTLLAQYVEDAAGGPYFCSPTYDPEEEGSECGAPILTLQAPTPPEEVVTALNDISAAKQEAAAQEARNKTLLTGSTGLRKALHELGLPVSADGLRAYSLYLAVTENGATILGADVIAPAPAEEEAPAE